MPFALVTVLVTLLGSGGAGGAPSATPTPAGAAALARLDELHLRRDDPAALREAHRRALDAVGAAPTAYDPLWRAARVLFTESDVPGRSSDERSRLGKEAYDLAERAIAANANGVEGHYWSALAIGSYAEGMGVLRALANGIEGKFTRPLARATALDVRYDHGSIPVVWAAYHLELPWPKRDRAKATEELKQALALNPANLRARLYLARIAADEGRPAEAKALLEAIAQARAGAYDPPEERRVKQEAIKLAATLR